MRNFLIQFAVAILLLAAGFLLALIGAVLFGVGLMLWAFLLLLGILLLDGVHGRGPFERKTSAVPELPAVPALERPLLRMADELTMDPATRRHAVYFRLRFWNEGGGGISPEVRVTRVVLSGGKDAAFSGQLPLLLSWSSLATPPVLTRQHTAGETVGVLGALNWIDRSDLPAGSGFPIDPPSLYIAGAEHHAEIGQTDEKVYVKVQAFVPGRADVATIERWFWVQIEKAKDREGYSARSGHLEGAPETSDKEPNTTVSAPPMVPVSTDRNDALVVAWLSQRMWNLRYRAWMFLLRYRVTNRSAAPIDIIHTRFQGPPQAITTPEIDQERQRVEAEIGVPPKTVPAGGSIDRWYLGEFEWNPDLGEPEYEIRLKASNGGHEYGFRRSANPKRQID